MSSFVDTISAKYEKYVASHPEIITQVESTIRVLSYLIPGGVLSFSFECFVGPSILCVERLIRDVCSDITNTLVGISGETGPVARISVFIE